MGKIIVVTPPYHKKSAGVVMLHFLSHSLNTLGRRSSLLILDPRDPTNQTFIFPDNELFMNAEYDTNCISNINQISDDDIVIYPEIIANNPLNLKKVVRYFLNKNGYITGKFIDRNSSEFNLSFSDIYLENADHKLFYPGIHLDNFPSDVSLQDKWLTLAVQYLGKGPKYQQCPNIPGTLSLDSKERSEYELLLRRAPLLLTYDPMSGVNIDAVLYGCQPVYLDKGPWTIEELQNTELKVPYVELDSYQDILKNFEHYYSEFLEKRKLFINDIRLYQSMWPENVKDFVQKCDVFFI